MPFLWPHYVEYPHASPLDRSITTDTLIIGAGITGLCAAHTMAYLYPNRAITLVDKGPIRVNASNNNAGFAMRISRFFGPWSESRRNTFNRTNRINEYGFNYLKELTANILNEAHWQEVGLIHAGQSNTALQNDLQYQACLEKSDIEHSIWHQADIERKLGSSFYRHGVFVNKGCALIQPAELTKALIEALPENVRLHFDSNVSMLNDDGSAEINGHLVKAQRVILASNWHLVNTPFKRPNSFGLTLAGSITKPLSEKSLHQLGELKQWGLLSSHPMGATVRLTHDNRLMLRNCVYYNKNRLLSNRQLEKVRLQHQSALSERFAHIDFKIERSWSAIEGRTINETSYFKKLNDRTYMAAIYNGSGITKGAALGAHIAFWATSNEGPLMQDILTHFAPPSYCPKNKQLINLGVNTALRFKKRNLSRE